MPSKPAKQCSKPGCRGIVAADVCSVCGPQAKRVDNRPSARRRGYDHRWNKIAKLHKRSKPLCQVCEAEGRTTIATASHHLTSISGGGAVHVAEELLLAVCESCHKRIEPLGNDWRKAIRSNGRTPRAGYADFGPPG